MRRLYVLLSTLLAPLILYPQIFYTDVADAAGIGEVGYNYGVSVVDYDRDGWEDIYITRRQGPNRLWRNMGDGTYTELAASAGIAYPGDAKTAAWADINNDGFWDLYLGTLNEGDFLYLNQGDGTFLDISSAAGMYAQKECIAAAFGDYDHDGLVDLYCARLNDQNTLYRNLGNNTFADVTFQTGTTDTLVAMGAMWIDYDNDGDQDLYLVHDAQQANILYRNNGQGQFTDVAVAAGVDYAGFGMGVDAGDINHDGWMDLYISNLYHNTCYLNNGDGTFADISVSGGVNDNGMGWSTAFLDADNDGWQDIYLSNTPFGNDPYPNVLYQNLGDSTFLDVSVNTTLASNGNGFGMATGDLDQDGWVDIIVTNSIDNRGNELFRNLSSPSHHYLTFELTGSQSNRAAIGTRVDIKANGFWQADIVTAGSGWASQNSCRLHFGLGVATSADSVRIQWPSGQIDYLENVPADQLIQFAETGSATSLQPIIGKPNLHISPNPARDLIKVRIPEGVRGAIHLSMMDLQGRERLRKNFVSDGSGLLVNWPLDNIPAGIYLIRLLLADTQISRRIVVRK